MWCIAAGSNSSVPNLHGTGNKNASGKFFEMKCIVNLFYNWHDIFLQVI